MKFAVFLDIDVVLSSDWKDMRPDNPDFKISDRAFRYR